MHRGPFFVASQRPPAGRLKLTAVKASVGLRCDNGAPARVAGDASLATIRTARRKTRQGRVCAIASCAMAARGS